MVDKSKEKELEGGKLVTGGTETGTMPEGGDTVIPAETETGGEPAPEVKAEGGGENQPTAPNGEVSDEIEQVKTLVTKLSPEADVSTPENILKAALPLLLSLDNLNTWMIESADRDPEAYGLLSDLKKGYTWPVAIARNFDPDKLNVTEESEDYGLVQEGLEKWRKSKAEQEALLATHGENQVATGKNFESACKTLGIEDDEEKKAALISNMESLIVDAKDYMITEENWVKAGKGMMYDTTIEEKETEIERAYEDGEISGRNQKIEEKRLKKETSDGLPHMQGAGANDKTGNKKMKLPMRKEFRV